MRTNMSIFAVGLICAAAALHAQPTPVNVSVSPPTPVGGGVYDFVVDVDATSAGDPMKLIQVHLVLSNTYPFNGFDCHPIASVRDRVMYLADDVGDWGPNPRDYYTPNKILSLKVTNGGTVYQTDTATPNDWPNNSQCTLLEEGSNAVIQGSHAFVTFRLLIKPPVGGDLWASVSSYMEVTYAGSTFGVWSEFTHHGARSFSDITDSSPVILSAGFASNSGDFRVNSGKGPRDTFFFRFSSQYGAQQVIFAGVSASPANAVSEACQVEIGVTTETFALIGVPGILFASSPPVENSYCKFYPSGSRVQYLSTTEVLVRLDLEFKSPWAGQNVYFVRRATHPWPSGAPPWGAWGNPDGFVHTADPEASSGLSLDSFRTCISAAGGFMGSDCVLAGATWIISSASQTLRIGRSNITIRGVSKHKAVLARPTFGVQIYPIMEVDPSGPAVHGVTISDLTFDGGRYGTGEPDAAGDLVLFNIDGTASNTSTRFLVKNCRFVNAAVDSIAAHPAFTSTPTRGIVIEHNEFRHSRRAAIHVGLTGIWYPSSCDTQGDSSAYTSSAVKDVWVRNNLFENNDTGAFGLDATRGQYGVSDRFKIANNAMLDNYDNGLDCGGGVIAAGGCARHLDIESNFMWNRNVHWMPGFCSGSSGPDPWAQSDGLELWGSDITVVGNRIEYFPGAGISAATVQRVTISGNLIRNTSRSIQQSGLPPETDFPGIVLANCGALKPDAYRDQVRNVAVTNNTITNQNTINQSYGFAIRPMTCGGSGDSVMRDITVSGLAGVNRLRASCLDESVALEGASSSFLFCSERQDARLGDITSAYSCGTSGCSPQ